MKKSLKEAGLTPGENKILSMYPALAPAIKNTLTSLRKSNPNITIQQVAQQLMGTPAFSGNQQLAAISKINPESAKSTAQVSQMFAKNPINRVAPPPSNILNFNPNQANVQRTYGYDPVQHSQNVASEIEQGTREVAQRGGKLPPIQMPTVNSPAQKRAAAPKVTNPITLGQTQPIDPNTMQAIASRGQPQQVAPTPPQPQQMTPQQVAQRARAVRPSRPRMQQNEAFSMTNLNNLGPSLQKVVKAISGLQPQDLTLLMKLLASMTQGNTTGQAGQTSMTRTTMTSSQKYSKNQILEMLKKDILKEELISTIRMQTENYHLVESMLKEGPLSNVWSGIKNAGASVLNKIKSIGDKTGLATGQASPEEQSKAYSGELMKMIKKAHQTRQQFKSQVLKNAEIINAYQDAVSAAWESFSHVANSLGPHSGVIKSQVDELVSNLKYDLESEKEQIQSFLKVLGDLRGSAPDSSMARGSAEFKRHEEAEAARRMKNPITGKRMSGSSVDPEIIKDTDKDLVDELVKKAIRGDKAALEKLRDIQAPKMKAAAKAERAKKETKK